MIQNLNTEAKVQKYIFCVLNMRICCSKCTPFLYKGHFGTQNVKRKVEIFFTLSIFVNVVQEGAE